MKCFIDAIDVLYFKPLMPNQALLEMLKTLYPDCPIDGTFLLKIRDGFTITTSALPERGGFMYTFYKNEK